jgi:hypothetical protein
MTLGSPPVRPAAAGSDVPVDRRQSAGARPLIPAVPLWTFRTGRALSP